MIVDPIALIGGIKKKYEDAKAALVGSPEQTKSLQDTITSYQQPIVDAFNSAMSSASNFLTGNQSVTSQLNNADRIKRQLEVPVSQPSSVDNFWKSAISKADTKLTEAGFQPSDKDAVRSALNIAGLLIPGSAPLADQGVNLASVFTQDPKEFEKSLEGPQSGIGIGRGIVTSRKGEISPARWAKFKDIYKRRWNVDIDAPLNVHRQQQENVPFGASQVRIPFYTTAERADRDNFYNHGPGASEGGDISVRESFQPKMPLDMVTSSEFFGKDLTSLFTGGGKTKYTSEYAGTGEGNWPGVYESERVPSRINQGLDVQRAALSPHEFLRAANARASHEALIEGTGAALANRGGIDWIYKQTPPSGRFKEHYPTQLIHSDMPVLRQRMKDLQDSLGIPLNRRNKLLWDTKENRFKEMKKAEPAGPGGYPFKDIVDAIHKEPLFHDLDSKEQAQFMADIKGKWKTSSHISPWNMWSKLNDFAGKPYAAASELKDYVKSFENFKNLSPANQQEALDNIHIAWKADKKTGFFEANNIVDKVYDKYGPSPESNTPKKATAAPEQFFSSTDAIDHMYHDSLESHKLSSNQKATLAYQIEDAYDNSPHDSPMTSHTIKDMITNTLNESKKSTGPVDLNEDYPQPYNKNIEPLYSHAELENSYLVGKALENLPEAHVQGAKAALLEKWKKDPNTSKSGAQEFIKNYKPDTETPPGPPSGKELSDFDDMGDAATHYQKNPGWASLNTVQKSKLWNSINEKMIDEGSVSPQFVENAVAKAVQKNNSKKLGAITEHPSGNKPLYPYNEIENSILVKNAYSSVSPEHLEGAKKLLKEEWDKDPVMGKMDAADIIDKYINKMATKKEPEIEVPVAEPYEGPSKNYFKLDDIQNWLGDKIESFKNLPKSDQEEVKKKIAESYTKNPTYNYSNAVDTLHGYQSTKAKSQSYPGLKGDDPFLNKVHEILPKGYADNLSKGVSDDLKFYIKYNTSVKPGMTVQEAALQAENYILTNFPEAAAKLGIKEIKVKSKSKAK